MNSVRVFPINYMCWARFLYQVYAPKTNNEYSLDPACPKFIWNIFSLKIELGIIFEVLLYIWDFFFIDFPLYIIFRKETHNGHPGYLGNNMAWVTPTLSREVTPN